MKKKEIRRWFDATLSSRLDKSIPDTGVLWIDNVAVCVLVLGIWDTEFPQNWQIENGFKPESRPQMEHLMDGRKGGAYLT